MKRVHLPVVHRSVSQEWLLIFRCQVRCVASTTLQFFFFRFYAFFFFRNWNARKKGWTGPLEVQGETSLAFQLGMWTSEKDSNLSLHKVRPIEAMMMMLMTIKTYRVVRKFSVSKCWPKCWERERCMRCMTIDVSSSVWVICPVKNRCKSMSTYLLCSMFQRLYVSPSDAPTCKIGDQTFFVVDLWDWDVVNKTLTEPFVEVGRGLSLWKKNSSQSLSSFKFNCVSKKEKRPTSPCSTNF